MIRNSWTFPHPAADVLAVCGILAARYDQAAEDIDQARSDTRLDDEQLTERLDEIAGQFGDHVKAGYGSIGQQGKTLAARYRTRAREYRRWQRSLRYLTGRDPHRQLKLHIDDVEYFQLVELEDDIAAARGAA